MEPIQVLIADDDPEMLEVLARVVEADASMNLVGAARGAGEAIDLASRHRPDVALLDVRMPDGGGPVAARGIRRCSPKTDIIALSTFEAPENVMTMLEAGASGYVSKGDSTLEIVRAIRRCRQGKTALSGRIRDAVAEDLAQQVSRRAAGTPMAKRRDRILRFIDGEGLDVVFQPIVELGTGRVLAVEALSRFVSKPRRSPDFWFREASEAGLGVPLEHAAARKALSSLASLPPSVCLSVNFSPQAIESAEFSMLVARQPLDRLIVEVTEQTDASGSLSLEETLAPWRWAGLLVAVDDAGAGYSTLNRIVQLRPEFIKLDITMTRRIETDAARQLLVEKLQGFATEVGATLIAEGIETDGQIDKLLSLGVGAGQGFRLGRPGPLPPVGEDGELVWKGRHAFEDHGHSSSAGDAITPAQEGA